MGPLTIDGGLMVWTLVTFGLMFALLARFAFRPLRRVLDERERVIRESIEQAAATARKEAAALLDTNRRQMDEARIEARRIISEGQKIVVEMRREGEERARAEAETILVQARADIEREVQKGLTDLKSTVADLSLRIARQVIRERLDPAQHERMADEFIERLKQTHART